MAVSQKIRIQLPFDLDFYIWICAPKNLQHGLKETFVQSCEQKHYSQVPRDQNNPNMHPWNGKMWDIYIMEYLISVKKEDSDSYYNVEKFLDILLSEIRQ